MSSALQALSSLSFLSFLPGAEWLAPALGATVGITTTEQGSRGLIAKFRADASVFAESHMVYVGLACLPSLMRAPGGIRASMNIVPWWITAIVAAVRTQAIVWVSESVQYAPNPGFAKMAVNLNTVWGALPRSASRARRPLSPPLPALPRPRSAWSATEPAMIVCAATAVSPMLFGSKLSPLNMAGVVLATVGTYLCTAGKEAYNRAVPKSFTHGVTRKVASEIELTAWLVPGILASLTLTAVEMGGRMITTRFGAEAGLFMQSQLAMCGLVSVVRLFRFPGGLINGLGLATRDPTRHHHNADPYVQGRQQWRQENWHQEGWRQAAWRQVPWYYNIVCVSPLAFSPNVVL